jgi:hypothetical protein
MVYAALSDVLVFLLNMIENESHSDLRYRDGNQVRKMAATFWYYQDLISKASFLRLKKDVEKRDVERKP